MLLRLDALRRAAAYCLTFGMLVLGCTDSHPGAPNGQTHWLRKCTGSAECGTLLCICGVCSAECDNGESCKAAVGEAAACKAAATASKKGQCPAAVAEKKICVAECSDDAECMDRGSDLRCASGICRLRNVSPSIADGGPPATTEIAARGGAIDDRRASSTSPDAGAGGPTSPADDTSSDKTSSDKKSSDEKSSDGTGGTDEPAPSVVSNELTCEDGEPGPLPAGVALIVSDIGYTEWTVSKDVLTWAAETEPVVLRRQALEGGNATSVPSSVMVDASDNNYMYMAAYGSDALVVTQPPSEPSKVVLRLVPDTGPALNIALQPGAPGGSPVLDAEAAYWLGTSIPAGMTALWRSPRTPGESVSLGEAANVVFGPVVVGGFLYVASRASATSQVFRAAMDGSSSLAALGPELNLVDDLITDGTDLLALLEPELDQLNNPIVPWRVVRMTPEGIVTDVAMIEETLQAGFARIAVASNTLYWNANHYTSAATSGTLWSAPADGSSAPAKAITSPNGSFGDLVSNQGDLYFALVCPVEPGVNRMHIMRLRP